MVAPAAQVPEPKAVQVEVALQEMRPRSVDLTDFDLDFAGGTVRDFIEVVSQAADEPLNVILNPELEDTEIPPLKLHGVTVPMLFEAVAAASRKVVTVPAGPPGATRNWNYSHGFRTSDQLPSGRSIWVFFRDQPEVRERPATAEVAPPVERPQVRVLNLTTYLQGRTIEDITTAIRTACGMVEDATQPKLTFHKETNLLIIRGTEQQLEIIGEVLEQLAAAAPSSAPSPMSPELMRRYGLTPPEAAPQPPLPPPAP